MAISINWVTKVIFIPRADLPIIQVSPFEVRQHDVSIFRLQLRDLEDNPDGRIRSTTHLHETESILSGISYARKVVIINGYTIEYEDGQYGVTLINANNNVVDVKVANQVSVIANNSGGLIGSEQINNQSYLNGRIYINTLGDGTPGDTFPSGTPTDPIDAWGDAYTISSRRRLSSFQLKGPLDFNASTSDPLNGTDWYGSSPLDSSLVFDGRSNASCTFHELLLSGQMNGEAVVEYCDIADEGLSLTNFKGKMHFCSLNNILGLDAAATRTIKVENSSSGIAGDFRPELDCNNTIANIYFVNWSGGLKVSNFTSGNDMSLNVNHGTIEIDASCTAGTIVIRGMYKLIDNSGPNCTVITEGAVEELVWKKVGCI